MEFDNNLMGNTGLESTLQFATFTQRVFASLIDIAVLFPLMAFNALNILNYKSFALWVGITLLIMAYKPLMEFRCGATVGKMKLGISVISEDHSPITIHQAITRYLPWIITNITGFYATMVLFEHPDFSDVQNLNSYMELLQSMPKSDITSIAGYILVGSIMYILFNAKNQAGHDLIAQTLVIHKKSES